MRYETALQKAATKNRKTMPGMTSLSSIETLFGQLPRRIFVAVLRGALL